MSNRIVLLSPMAKIILARSFTRSFFDYPVCWQGVYYATPLSKIIDLLISEGEPVNFHSKHVDAWYAHMDEWTQTNQPGGISALILHRPKLPYGKAMLILKNRSVKERRRLFYGGTMSWKTVKNRIMNHDCSSQTWQSEQKSLLYVIEKAKLLNCDSSNAERATISNLRTIAPKAHRAAYNNQPAELDRLFQMATEYSCTDLRIALGKRRESNSFHTLAPSGPRVVLASRSRSPSTIAS